MDAVVEIDEARQIVDAMPAERLVGSIAFADRFEHGAADPDLAVAVHAGLGGRDAGEGGVFDRGVAVAAIDPQNARVVLVAERNRLDDRLPHAGSVGRPRVDKPAPEQAAGKKETPKRLILASTFILPGKSCGILYPQVRQSLIRSASATGRTSPRPMVDVTPRPGHQESALEPRREFP